MKMRKLRWKEIEPYICWKKEEDVCGKPEASTQSDTSIYKGRVKNGIVKFLINLTHKGTESLYL